MKLMKRAAEHNIPSQVRHQKSLSIFGRNRTLSEHVEQLRFGKKTGKVYTVFIQL